MTTHHKTNEPCPEQSDIMAYLREELGTSESETVKAHLLECPSCSSVMTEFQNTIGQLLSEDEEIDVSRDIVSEVMEQIAQDKDKTDNRLNMPFFAFKPKAWQMAASFLLLLGLSYIAVTQMQSKKRLTFCQPRSRGSGLCTERRNAVADQCSKRYR